MSLFTSTSAPPIYNHRSIPVHQKLAIHTIEVNRLPKPASLDSPTSKTPTPLARVPNHRYHEEMERKCELEPYVYRCGCLSPIHSPAYKPTKRNENTEMPTHEHTRIKKCTVHKKLDTRCEGKLEELDQSPIYKPREDWPRKCAKCTKVQEEYAIGQRELMEEAEKAKEGMTTIRMRMGRPTLADLGRQ
ncbi:hypothetical protein P154DRAFT_522562 [Amniculicola lignicola CBS 123094]|uniref:Uncharacterized protein n=1 Tax=Amniculicola lignicola CBS 123094 TaxID=1392246 RepID=A0A6A5WER9_9PLEO|nr:hypothetical protein P154DRAFT_522562 [Amniculicola lignicola CBS 123094]